MSEIQELVKEQFNKQAQKFSIWSVSKNVEYQRFYLIWGISNDKINERSNRNNC